MGSFPNTWRVNFHEFLTIYWLLTSGHENTGPAASHGLGQWRPEARSSDQYGWRFGTWKLWRKHPNPRVSQVSHPKNTWPYLGPLGDSPGMPPCGKRMLTWLTGLTWQGFQMAWSLPTEMWPTFGSSEVRRRVEPHIAWRFTWQYDRCQALVLVLSRWEASSLSIPKRLKFKGGLEGVAQVEVVMIGLISGLIGYQKWWVVVLNGHKSSQWFAECGARAPRQERASSSDACQRCGWQGECQ